MAHFMYFAGYAYNIKVTSKSPIPFINETRAYIDANFAGLGVEIMQSVTANDSSFSSEDMSSNALGAYFGAYVFDSKSRLTLAEQVVKFLEQFGITDPEKADDWDQLPQNP